jgi:hypothetical protein
MPNSIAIPVIGNISRAMDFISGDLWICIGRTTPWPDENNPPIVSPDILDVEEPVIFKKADVKTFVVEDTTGEYIVQGVTYKAVSEEFARNNLVTTILIKATITDTDISDDVTFRQVGLYSKLVPTAGNEGKTLLLPSEVEFTGYLEWVSNREPLHIQPNQYEVFYIVFNF